MVYEVVRIQPLAPNLCLFYVMMGCLQPLPGLILSFLQVSELLSVMGKDKNFFHEACVFTYITNSVLIK